MVSTRKNKHENKRLLSQLDESLKKFLHRSYVHTGEAKSRAVETYGNLFHSNGGRKMPGQESQSRNQVVGTTWRTQ